VCRAAAPTRELLEARRGITHKDIKGDREAELVRRYQAGDRHAGEILLLAHSKFIAFTTTKYSKGSHDLDPEELLAEGQIGFLRSVETYDPTAGALTTYADAWIRSKVERAKLNTGKPIRLPAGLCSRKALEAGTLRAEAARNALHIARLDTPIGDDDGACLGDLIAGGDNPETELAEREWGAVSAEMLADALAFLPPKAADVLRRRAEGETLEEIGQSYEISRERVRQIEKLAKEAARRHIGQSVRLRLSET
jgi:RNA polymerase primary sigma factor